MQKYINALNKFYDKEKIGVDSFNCKFSKNCHQSRKVFMGSDTHVGSNYGKPQYRIVVISLDRGEGAENLKNRQNEIQGLGDDLNRHMKGTRETLLAFLGNTFENDIFSRYAMINASKCCLDDGTMNKAPKEFFENCRGFVLEELNILEPDIIITQGREAKQVISTRIEKIDVNEIDKITDTVYPSLPKSIKDTYIFNIFNEYLYWFTLSNNKKVITVCPVHPSERYGRWSTFKKIMLPVVGEICKIVANYKVV